jgi:hypothetical protein
VEVGLDAEPRPVVELVEQRLRTAFGCRPSELPQK